MIKKSKTKSPSELRLDLISKDWVVIATGRGKRPEMFKREKRAEIKVPKKECPFCNVGIEEKPLLIYVQGKKIPLKDKTPTGWTTMVVSNKFPAFSPLAKFEKKVEGSLYQTIPAVGFCELVVTRDHEKSLGLLPKDRVKEVFDSYQERYLELMEKKHVNYVSIFHNHGPEAGASQPHPHSQIITSPLIDVDLRSALFNSKKYFRKAGKCIYCQMNDWEKKNKKRIVFENENFLAICPFASKAAFEIIISPKKHLPYFEKITENEKWQLSQTFQVALKKLYKALNNPAYNFYLHTAPCDGVAEVSPHLPERSEGREMNEVQRTSSRLASRGSANKYPFYHWHWTILPKTATWAGFEIGTRMEISTIEPEKAAEYLRRH